MIPAFALERTQEMLFELNDMVEKKEIPAVPVFVDSPLAIKLTDVYRKYSRDPSYFNESIIGLVRLGENIFDFPGLTMTLTKEESKKINDVPPPKIIIAGAGMSNGGRVLHHEVRYLSDPRSTLLIVGYQSVNSLGRRLLDGERQVEILGQIVEVKATILSISGYSAHADQNQLLDWILRLGKGVKKIFVIQGDGNASDVLAEKIREKFSLEASAPSRGDSVLL
jgi:metallo-beta-lactamase family protein